ncbi:unnamed protein product [Effrenium voratum]|uniref:Uncharacterized protein n=1 Tax=Effrenium voratum TaxID=2562239 RepID=A0AA36HQK6_9DINO|nr:unnamed protein product [Effrenium voratum]
MESRSPGVSPRQPVPRSKPRNLEEEECPRLLSLGGREGPGQQINGDYELVEGVRPNGRPCWIRRGKPLQTKASGWAEHDGELRPLYLFFGEMGYWSVAASVLAAGVHVLARSGPDFSSPSPNLCAMPWTVFAFGKAYKDPSIACFRHVKSAPDAVQAVHVTGCKGDHGQLNGTYHVLQGVWMGSRPAFVKDDGNERREEERKVMHFSQRSGRWFISSCSLSAWEDQSDSSEEMAVPKSHGASTLARSPVAWTSSSPASLPNEPWSIIRTLPTRLQFGMTERRRSLKLAESDRDGASEHGPVTFVPCQELQVHVGEQKAQPRSVARSLSRASQREASPDLDATVQLCASEHEETELQLCLHFLNHAGLAERFGLSGDYVRSDQLYGDRPVFIKAALRRGGIFEVEEKSVQDRPFFLFYDDLRHRWEVAPEVGAKGLSVLARSPIGWDEGLEKDLGAWQMRTAEPELSIFLPRGKKAELREDSHMFQDCKDLAVVAVVDQTPPRTVAFFCQGEAEVAVAEHPLAGDFRLLRQRYGMRPVYRRTALQACGPGPGLPAQPGLFLFFEPRSGYWVVSTISPLAASHAVASARPDALGRFGQVLARSGPNWTCTLPQDAASWEAADSQAPGCHYRHGPARAPPSSLLSEQLVQTPWLQLGALQAETPQFLCISGCGTRLRSLNGCYELLDESMWASRPAWKRLPKQDSDEELEFPKYLFFWPETGHWMIGPDLHHAPTGLARNGPGRWAAQSPDYCPGRWAALNGHTFSEDPKIFCRRQKGANGGVETFGLSSSVSPCQSLGPRAKAMPAKVRRSSNSPEDEKPVLKGKSLPARPEMLPGKGEEKKPSSLKQASRNPPAQSRTDGKRFPREVSPERKENRSPRRESSPGNRSPRRESPRRDCSPLRNSSPGQRGICWRP